MTLPLARGHFVGSGILAYHRQGAGLGWPTVAGHVTTAVRLAPRQRLPRRWGGGFMAYVPEWERLPSALRRVKASKRSTHEAQIEICRAIDEGKIRYQLFSVFTDDDLVSGLHPGIASQIREGLRSGQNLAAWRGQLGQLLYPLAAPVVNPTDLPSPPSPRALDWRKSSFKEPWLLTKSSITAPTRCHVRIEVFRDDVTNVLCRGRRAATQTV